MSLRHTQFCKFPDDKAAARVAVAKDVIAQVRANVLEAAQQGYIAPRQRHWSFSNSEARMAWWDALEASFEGVAARCSVCAMGSLLMSSFRLFDGEGFAAIQRDCGAEDDDIFFQLDGLFSRGQLRLMEKAFEGWRYPYEYESEGLDGSDYVSAFYDTNQRLIAIMQNVVKNGGEFIPERRPVLEETP